MTKTFSLNDPVYLIYDKRRRWLRTVVEDQFHCNYGSVDLSELIDQPYGTKLETSKGKYLKAIPPSIIDWINSFEHRSQIIYEKDAAMICMLLDIRPGDTVYEAGTGSGSLTTIMATRVGSDGKIITHENRKKAIEVAKRNTAKLKLDNIEFHDRDVKKDGFIPGETEAMILDMGDPWEVIEAATEVIVPGGKIVVFLPTFNQLGKTSEMLKEFDFEEVKAIELIEREIQLNENAIRPATRMIGHTGYLLSAIYLP